MTAPEYDGPVKFSDHVYWVGTFDETDNFQCNSYLILVDGKGIIIDPGSVLYFEKLLKKVSGLVALKDVSRVIVQHQDPDVCGCIAQLIEALRSEGNRNCRVITHRRTSKLIRHYGGSLLFEYPDEISDQKLKLGDVHELEFIHTPYLHAPGAIATYFHTDKVLFSGDLFGGMTDHWDLYADEHYFEKITSFHREYMPAKELLLFTMTKFERYDFERIAPQHGSILNKNQARSIIEKFKDFECGLFIDQSFRDELQTARKRIGEQNRIMSEELSLAALFQQTLLPDGSAKEWDDRVEIAYRFHPCSQVSGDFIIIDKIDERHLGILVIDVMGHGVMPGLATIQVKTLFDEHKGESLSPARILRTINERSFSVSKNDIFLTALYMIYDLEESVATVASAGGVPPIHFDFAKGEGKLIPIIGTPLGMGSSDECRIGEKRVSVGNGDFLIIQTDGLIECFNSKNEPFEHLKSQKKFMKEIRKGRNAQRVLDAIMHGVASHKGGGEFEDDVTIVVFRKK